VYTELRNVQGVNPLLGRVKQLETRMRLDWVSRAIFEQNAYISKTVGDTYNGTKLLLMTNK